MRFGTIVTAVFLLATTIMATPASAVCSLATLNGVYGYFHGRPGGAGPAPIDALVGQFTANGAGTITSGSYTLNNYGTITTGVFTGTYTLAASCMGTLTFSSEDISPAHFDIVLDDSNLGFQMLQSDNGYDQPGFGYKGPASCVPFNATLATNFVGVLTGPGTLEAIVGQLKLTTGLVITGKELFSVGLVNTLASVTGSYSLNTNCTGTAIINGGPPVTAKFAFVVVNKTELLMLEIDPGTFLGGTAQP